MAGRIQQTTDAAFDRFWAEYPNHDAKREAQKAWRQIAPDAELVERFMRALAWQKVSPRWTKNNGEFVPHAATWLRGARWEDEPPTSQARREIPFGRDDDYHRRLSSYRDECERLHGGSCGSWRIHENRMMIDRARAQRGAPTLFEAVPS